MGGEAAPDQPEQPEGATAQPSDELGRRAALRPPLSIPPIQSEGGNVDNVMKMKSGGYNQLLNPRWLAQSSFGDFFKRKVVDIAMTDRVKESNVLEGVAGERLRPETMVTSPITTDDCSNDDQNSFSITPSMRSDSNQRPKRMIDDEESKEDLSTISNEVGDMTIRECDIIKRRSWCNTHECVVKSMNVSSTKQQYSEKR